MRINLLKLLWLFFCINSVLFYKVNAQSAINEIEKEELQLLQNDAKKLLNGFKYALNDVGIMNMNITERKGKINTTINSYFGNNDLLIIDDDLLLDRQTNNEKTIKDYLESIAFFYNTYDVKFDFSNIEVSNLYRNKNDYFFIIKYNKSIEGKAMSNGNMLSVLNVGRVAQINYNPTNKKLMINSLLNQPYTCQNCKEVPIVIPPIKQENYNWEDELMYIKEEAQFIMEDYGYALNALGKINLGNAEKTVEVKGTLEQFFANAYTIVEDDFIGKYDRTLKKSAKDYLNELRKNFIEQDVEVEINNIIFNSTQQTSDFIILRASFDKKITGKLKNNAQIETFEIERFVNIEYNKKLNTCAIKTIKNVGNGIILPMPQKDNDVPIVTIPTLSEKEFENMLAKEIAKSKINTNGTAHALKSVIIPGWGTYSVSDNKNTGRIIAITGTTLAFFGTSYFTGNRSQKLYDDYAQYEIDSPDREDVFKQANLMNKLSLSTGIAGGLVWATDLVLAIAKGSKNTKNYQQFKNDFRQQTEQNYNISLSPQLSPNAVGITLEF